MSQGGGFLDADDVVFEAEVRIDVGLVLEVSGDDAAAVVEGEVAFGTGEDVRQLWEDATAQVFEGFQVRFSDFAQEQAFQTGDALAVVAAHLGKEPMGFATAAGAAITDGGRAIGFVAFARRGGSGELARLQPNSFGGKCQQLIARATDSEAFAEKNAWIEQ